MDSDKKNQISGVISQLKNVRANLDNIMYGESIISNKEFKTMREAYELICQAMDKLYEL